MSTNETGQHLHCGVKPHRPTVARSTQQARAGTDDLARRLPDPDGRQPWRLAAPMNPVLRTFVLATIAVPIFIHGLMPQTHKGVRTPGDTLYSPLRTSHTTTPVARRGHEQPGPSNPLLRVRAPAAIGPRSPCTSPRVVTPTSPGAPTFGPAGTRTAPLSAPASQSTRRATMDRSLIPCGDDCALHPASKDLRRDHPGQFATVFSP